MFQIKIADFGIAIRLSHRKRDLSQQITGTIDFVSPEYVKDGSFDTRSDIYALGVIAFVLLTGHMPFEHECIVETLAMKATQDAPLPSVFRTDVTPEICRLVASSLARDPSDRIQTCSSLIKRIDDILDTSKSNPDWQVTKQLVA